MDKSVLLRISLHEIKIWALPGDLWSLQSLCCRLSESQDEKCVVDHVVDGVVNFADVAS